MCAPVPSEHAVGFADMYKSVHGIPGTEGTAFLKCLCNILCRRMEYHSQFILFRLQKRLHFILPDTVHIVRRTDQLAVQINIGDGVHTVKMQYDTPAGQQVTAAGKLRYILIILIHQLQGFQLIVLKKRILHLPVAQHVRIHSSRNHRRAV